jgi:transcriptional regulator with XRE-family HTH domain
LTAEPSGAADDISPLVGGNLRRLRIRNGLSLERLAQASGVSRAMLGQIELGRSAPTITVLWKIARALDVPLAAFTTPESVGDAVVLRAHRSRITASRNGRFRLRALEPSSTPRRVEFLEVSVCARTIEEVDGHPGGTVATLVLAQGCLEIELGGASHVLEAGDSIRFAADLRHVYRNCGSIEALAYLVLVRP